MNNTGIKGYDWVMIVAVGLLVVSLGNFIFALGGLTNLLGFTGYATETGKANLTVESEANIAFFVNTTDWGSGKVNSSEGDYAIIDTEGTVTAGNWAPNTQPLVLHNIGNTNVILNLSAGKTPEEFINGSAGGGPLYQLKSVENETNACTGTMTNFDGVYENLTTSNTEVCSNLQYASGNNSLNFHINLRIPSDSPVGTKEDIITATATQVA